jgi:hypothetical protein
MLGGFSPKVHEQRKRNAMIPTKPSIGKLDAIDSDKLILCRLVSRHLELFPF